MDSPDMPATKPKTGVIITGVLASAIVFGGTGYYIGSMYETAPAGRMTYTTPAATALSEMDGWLTYTSADYHYTIQYPASYTSPSGSSTNSILFDYPGEYSRRAGVFVSDTAFSETLAGRDNYEPATKQAAKVVGSQTWQVYLIDLSKDSTSADQGKEMEYYTEYNGKTYMVFGSIEGFSETSAAQVKRNLELMVESFTFTD